MLYGTANTTEQLIGEVDGTLIVRVKYKDDPKPVDLVEKTFEVGSQNMSSQFSVVSLLSRLVALNMGMVGLEAMSLLTGLNGGLSSVLK